MTTMLPFALIGAVIAGLQAIGLWHDWRVRAENDRRYREWRADNDVRLGLGMPPLPPPNQVVRW